MNGAKAGADCRVKELKEKLDRRDDFLLLDVRNPPEVAVAKIDGAQLMPMNEVPQRLDELANWRDKEVVVQCHHGGRSARVQQFLQAQGFENVRNLVGGIEAWSVEIDPDVPRY